MVGESGTNRASNHPCWRRCRGTARKYFLHPPDPLVQVASGVPESPERPTEPQPKFAFSGFQRPRKRRTQVVVFLGQPLDPEPLLWSGQLRFGHFRKRQEESCVSTPDRLGFAAQLEFLLSVLTDGLEHPVAGAPSVAPPTTTSDLSTSPPRRSRTSSCSMLPPEHTTSAASRVHPPANCESRPNSSRSGSFSSVVAPVERTPAGSVAWTAPSGYRR